MLNFTNNITQYTTSAQRTHSTQFTTYSSKKQLQNANVLNAQHLQFLLNIKNTFTFAVHNNLQYVAITLYYASTKSYAFIVVNLHNSTIAQAQSIKHAKQAILQLVAQQAQQATATASTKANA